jgi:hypothetical protein
MWPFFVVFLDPVVYRATHLTQAAEHIKVQYLLTKCPVKTFHLGVLHRFAGLDKFQLYPVRFSPARKLY